jgi:hypothetical protein
MTELDVVLNTRAALFLSMRPTASGWLHAGRRRSPEGVGGVPFQFLPFEVNGPAR